MNTPFPKNCCRMLRQGARTPASSTPHLEQQLPKLSSCAVALVFFNWMSKVASPELLRVTVTGQQGDK
jgi:hypothetical protein